MLANNRAIARSAKRAQHRSVPALAARMGFPNPASTTTTAVPQPRSDGKATRAGIDWETLEDAAGRLVPRHTRRSRRATSRRLGQVRILSASVRAAGEDPLPAYVAAARIGRTSPALAQRYPLAFISPPARNFLNSSFANLAFFAEEGEPHLDVHPEDAAPRGIGNGGRFASSTTAARSARPRA